MTSTALTPSQFIALEKQAGFPQDQWAFGLATAEVESGLRPDAYNPSGATGLFQILSSHLGEPGIKAPLTDAKTNVEDAFVLFKKSGWEPWQCKGCEVPAGIAQSKLGWAQGQVKSFLKNGATGDSPSPSSSSTSNWMTYAVIGGAVLLILLLIKK